MEDKAQDLGEVWSNPPVATPGDCASVLTNKTGDKNYE
jgi:hypothetical protein